MRLDIDEATILWPERKFYLTTSIGSMDGMVGGIENMTVDRRRSGNETIGGEPCTRYEVSGTSPQGGDFHGRMWFTRDGIMMKAMGTVHFLGKETPIDLGLLNVRRMRIDPSAFVRPSDYRTLPFDLSRLAGPVPALKRGARKRIYPYR